MRHILPALALLLVSASVRADPVLPTAEGTTWEYASSETITGEAPKKSIVTVRATTQSYEGKEAVKLETVENNKLKKTDVILVDAAGIVCVARAGLDGKMANLVPAERVIMFPMRVGMKWDQEGEVAGIRMRQRWVVIGEETVTLPTKQYLAYHLRCEDSSLMSIKIDRWFAPGTGVVREMSVIRGPGVLHRVELELQSVTETAKPTATPRPTVTPTPEPAATPAPASPSPQTVAATTASPGASPEAATSPNEPTPAKKLTVEVSDEAAGGLKTVLKSSIANIYVRWHGHGLPENASVRVVWVAEDVGDLVEPNFVVDETESVAAAPDASAKFTLSRPPDGWAEGKYRVEFYIDDALTEIVRVTIEK